MHNEECRMMNDECRIQRAKCKVQRAEEKTGVAPLAYPEPAEGRRVLGYLSPPPSFSPLKGEVGAQSRKGEVKIAECVIQNAKQHEQGPRSDFRNIGFS
jgi:hypothetical protein